MHDLTDVHGLCMVIVVCLDGLDQPALQEGWNWVRLQVLPSIQACLSSFSHHVPGAIQQVSLHGNCETGDGQTRF